MLHLRQNAFRARNNFPKNHLRVQQTRQTSDFAFRTVIGLNAGFTKTKNWTWVFQHFYFNYLLQHFLMSVSCWGSMEDQHFNTQTLFWNWISLNIIIVFFNILSFWPIFMRMQSNIAPLHVHETSAVPPAMGNFWTWFWFNHKQKQKVY